MNRSQLRGNVQKVVDQVVALAHPLRIILFGSATGGIVDADSDLDFLVIVSENEQTEDVTDRLNTRVRNRPMPCDFMVVSPAVLERHKGNPGLIYSDILSHGREVYAA